MSTRTDSPRPTAGITNSLGWLLLAFVPARAVAQVLAFVVARLPAAEFSPSNALRGDGALAVAAGASICCVALPLGVAIAVHFAYLFQRWNANVRASGVPGLRFTPGWAAGSFFVPIANLLVPYLVACELWRASTLPPRDEAAQDADWRAQPVSSTVDRWWLCFVAALLADRASNVAERFGAAWGSAAPLAILQLALWIAAAWFARRFVLELDLRVTARVAVAARATPPAAIEGWS